MAEFKQLEERWKQGGDAAAGMSWTGREEKPTSAHAGERESKRGASESRRSVEQSRRAERLGFEASLNA
jgi:hypothetical protein